MEAEKENLHAEVEKLRQHFRSQSLQHEEEIARMREEVASLRKVCQKLEEQASVGKTCSADHFIRSVTWEINDFASKEKEHQKGDSMWSPKFRAAGLEGLQLEFFPKGRNETSSDGSKRPAPDGFCSLFLWCPSGAKIKYQMRVGNFLHAPDEDEYTGRIGHGHTSFCPLAPEVVDDTVVVGVEFLEVNLLSSMSDRGITLHSTSMEAMMAREVDWLRNKDVNKVVWKITRFSEKLETLPRGASMWSPVFTAGGIREILLEFYPNGSDNTQKEGYCAFYIRCPEGVEMVVTLFVGQKSKGPIKTKFDNLTGKGLPEFCEVREQVSKDDTLEVGITLTNQPKTVLELES